MLQSPGHVGGADDAVLTSSMTDKDNLHGSSRTIAEQDSSTALQTNDDATTLEEEELPFNAPLSHELFLSDSLVTSDGSFDVSSFLLTRRHLSLDDLRSELRTYLQTLRTQLVSIINSDYEDFINLGGSHLLGSEDQMSLRMRKPLEGISREIYECKNSLEEMRDELKMRLKKRELVRERKLVCRKLLAVNDQVIKVEEMLLIPSAATDADALTVPGQDTSSNTAGNGTLAVRNMSRRVSPAMAKKVDRCACSEQFS
jgi:hypothetical protein